MSPTAASAAESGATDPDSRSSPVPAWAIDITGLTVKRGHNLVLDGLDLQVRAGMVTGLLGPSGCGKTTLMRSIVGVQRVAGGQITVLGRPAGSAPLRHEVGYVTQAASVYNDLSVVENLRYFAAVLGTDRADVDRVIDTVGLRHKEHSLVVNLSGGERSRASLAVALLGSPALLVLDEPTVGLDPVLRRELWNLFAQLARQGTTLLVSSHVMDEASRCDRLLLMREGVILADATLPDLYRQTETDDVEAAFLTLIDRAERPGETA